MYLFSLHSSRVVDVPPSFQYLLLLTTARQEDKDVLHSVDYTISILVELLYASRQGDFSAPESVL